MNTSAAPSSAAAFSVLSGFRPTMPTVAPRRTSSRAASFPIPEVAPVTMIRFPSMARMLHRRGHGEPPRPLVQAMADSVPGSPLHAGVHHHPRLGQVPFAGTVQHAPVVPDHEVAGLPVVPVDARRLAGRVQEGRQERVGVLPGQAGDGVGVAADERARAGPSPGAPSRADGAGAARPCRSPSSSRTRPSPASTRSSGTRSGRRSAPGSRDRGHRARPACRPTRCRRPTPARPGRTAAMPSRRPACRSCRCASPGCRARPASRGGRVPSPHRIRRRWRWGRRRSPRTGPRSHRTARANPICSSRGEVLAREHQHRVVVERLLDRRPLVRRRARRA